MFTFESKTLRQVDQMLGRHRSLPSLATPADWDHQAAMTQAECCGETQQAEPESQYNVFLDVIRTWAASLVKKTNS